MTLIFPQTKFEPGKVYLLNLPHGEYEAHTNCFISALECDDKLHGLAFTRTKPEHLKEIHHSLRNERAELYWISAIYDSGDHILGPRSEYIFRVTEQFMEKYGEHALVYYDCLEFLIHHISFESIAKHFKSVVYDAAKKYNSAVLFTISEGTMDKEKMSYLEDKLEVIKPIPKLPPAVKRRRWNIFGRK